MNDDIGDILNGKYQILEKLGSGGVGTVYRAMDLALQRDVALKILQIQHQLSETAMVRFQREGRAIASLAHENVVRVFGFHIRDEQPPYLTMEYVNGRSLADVIESEGPLEYHRFVAIAQQIASALAYVHSQKIIHRDLKPANIMLAAYDQVKLLDFGIAKIVEDQSFKATRTGESVGTPVYMSPEQSTGTTIDERTDQYGLGCVLFEMLTGKPPFTAENSVALSIAHANAPIPSVNKSSGRRIPVQMDSLISKLLSKNPEHRFVDMVEVREKLKSIPSKDEPNNLVDRRTARPVILGVVIIAILLSSKFAFDASTSRITPVNSSTKQSEQHADNYNEADLELADFIRQNPNVKSIGKFANRGISDDGLKALIGHSSIRELFFGGCYNLTNACIPHLATLPLTTLTLAGTNINDDGIKAISSIKTLTNVNLTGTEITNKSCDYFELLPRLQILSVDNTKISDAGLTKLGRIKTLRFLNVGGTEVKDLAHSLKNSELDNLTLSKLHLTRADFERVSELKHLVWLYLDKAFFDPKDLLLLQALPRLKYVSCKDVELPGNVLKQLKELMPETRFATKKNVNPVIDINEPDK